jgi:hypothetical protein
MSTAIRLVALREESNFVPLGVLGYCLMRTQFLQPVFSELRLQQKTVKHLPEAKLIDLLVSILTGCRAIAQVNTRPRPDVVLAQAWERTCFTEQSLLADTLDAFDETALSQLRQGSTALLQREGRMFRHDFAQTWLWLDIDLTPLPISKLAEASTKGKFAKKTVMVANWRGFTHPETSAGLGQGAQGAFSVKTLAPSSCNCFFDLCVLSGFSVFLLAPGLTRLGKFGQICQQLAQFLCGQSRFWVTSHFAQAHRQGHGQLRVRRGAGDMLLNNGFGLFVGHEFADG